MSDLLKTICYIADANAEEVRARAASRAGVAREPTVAEIEAQEWEEFRSKLDRARQQLGDLELVDEEDADQLMVVLDIVKRGKHLTTFEIMRELQHRRVVSTEFVAAARAQTNALLSKLRKANRVWADQYGRWALL